MKSNLLRWQFIGFAFTAIFGVLLHFAYDWSGENGIVAVFSGVNESTWEHMKLLFFPLLVYALIESRRLRDDYPNFWCVKLRGVLLGLIMIPVIFYTANGVFGKTPDWFNITIFFIAAAIAFIYEIKLLKRDKVFCLFEKGAFLILVILALLFVIFTFFPPHIPLFMDPITKLYGI